MADISMPQLGETVTEGTITKWFKAVGDQVAEDEPLFEVSTDKVDTEVPSPTGGYLTEIRVPEGDTVDVGTVLAVVSADAGGVVSADAGGAVSADAGGAVSAEAPAAEPEAPPAAEPEAPPATEPEAPPAAEPEAPPVVQADHVEPSVETPAAEAPAPAGDGIVLSPVVRKLINEHHLDPAAIEGTGPGGRITRSDVQRIVDAEPGSPEAKAAPAPTGPAAPARPAAPTAPMAAPKAGERDVVEPLNNIRRRTGEHMVRSKATSPHAFIAMEVDYEGVEAVRAAHKEEFKAQEGYSLTFLPFIARAMIDAIAEFPHMNATVGEGELIVHPSINLGIAVDLNYEGLIVPVIHEAQDKRLRALAHGVHDLAGRARGKQLSADDISGGTVTITNLGSAGTIMNLPVINQPQVMILSTEGVFRKPVVVTDGSGHEAIAIHSVGNLSLGWDHRAFDGAYASAFLRRVVEILETRDWAAEL